MIHVPPNRGGERELLVRDAAGRSTAIRTFLIADVRGYTRYTAQHGDEAASRLATRFAEVMSEGAAAYGGEVVELRGDEALAVFESARQALRAAVELEAAFAGESRAYPEQPLPVGIGLDAGEAVPVGDGYRGAALNVAARLCGIAGAGDVIASAGLVRLTGPIDGLHWTPLEPTRLKGLDEAVPAVRVTPIDGAEPQYPEAAAGLTTGAVPVPPVPAGLDPVVPLCGRRQELLWLRWHWRRASHARGRAVVLSGQPGIGKTRLAAELASVAHADGATVVYVPAARAGDLDRVRALEAPALLVVDDLDAAPQALVAAIAEYARSVGERPILVVVTHREEAPATFVRRIEAIAAPEHRLRLGPLDADAVRSIASLYTGRHTDALPLNDLITASGGVPAAVHQVASLWARLGAMHRLQSSAEQTAASRAGLRAAEQSLIANVTDLETVRDRTSLYVTPPEAGDGRASADVCPYKGLAVFDAADADYYFGRERLVAELVARLVGSGFVALVGDSGSGKSSALRAGLLPALQNGVLPGSDRWVLALMRPGEQPVEELRRALARASEAANAAAESADALEAALAALPSGGRLVLLIDQFEEIFTTTRDASARGAFIDLVTGEREGLKVVVAIRADRYGDCAAYPSLARRAAEAHVLVGALTRAEIKAVIEHPAGRVGLRVEPQLTEALIDDAGTQSSVLPLLSTALLELWQARENGTLTASAYRASGGLRAAIARLAEAAYARLDPHRQAIARSILLRLAGPGEGDELVRRRVSLREFDVDRDPAVAEVLATLTDARLLTTGDGHVEVAHEALLREWPRLQGWLVEDAAGRAVRLHLAGAVRDWEARGRESSDLYRGARLSAALEWAADHDVDLNTAERTFLDESRGASELELERQRRTNRRLRALLAGAAVLLVAAVGAGALAAVQGQRAADEAARAEVEARRAGDQAALAGEEAARARARELTASAIAALDVDPALSKLLALQAGTVSEDRPLQLQTTVHQAFAADPVVGRYRWPEDKDVGMLWTDLDPSGERLVASGAFYFPSNHLEVAEVATGTVLWSYSDVPPGVAIGPSHFFAEGRQVIAGLYWDNPDAEPAIDELGAFIWDASSGELVRRVSLGPCGGMVTAVSEARLLVRSATRAADGTQECVFGLEPGTFPSVEVLELDSGVTRILAREGGLGWGSTMSADGRIAAFDPMDRGRLTSVVVDLASGDTLLEIDPAVNSRIQHEAYARRLNRDGSLLLYGNRPIYVYDVESGGPEPIARLGGQAGESRFAEFDAAGETVYETAQDRRLRRWNARDGTDLGVWPAIGNGRPSISSDTGTVLVTDVDARTAALVETRPRGEIGAVETCPGFGPGFVPATGLDAAGGFAALNESCGGDDTKAGTHVVELGAQKVVHSVADFGGQSLSVSPDGTRFVSQVLPWPVFGPLEIRDTRSGRRILRLEGLCTWDANAWHLEGIPRAETGDCNAYPEQPFPFLVGSTDWSPDGSMIASVDRGDGQAVVWDASDGRILYTQPVDADYTHPRSIVFSPESGSLYVSSARRVRAISTDSWSVIREVELDEELQGGDTPGLAGFTADGRTLLMVGGWLGGGGGALHWLDAETMEVTRSVNEAHEGSPRSMAVSQNGSLLATGASDGLLRVWSMTDGSLIQEIQVGREQVQGVAFVDDRHVAVAPQSGDLLIYTLDTDELLNVVRSSLTRGFTERECSTYGIDPCPTLAEIRGP